MYLNMWERREDVMDSFQVGENELSGCSILLASYTCETYEYEADAFVLFEKDGKLYEVNGSHCSCSGLEGQWEPEETTVPELKYRMKKGNLGGKSRWTENVFKDELLQVLSEYEKQ